MNEGIRTCWQPHGQNKDVEISYLSTTHSVEQHNPTFPVNFRKGCNRAFEMYLTMALNRKDTSSQIALIKGLKFLLKNMGPHWKAAEFVNCCGLNAR